MARSSSARKTPSPPLTPLRLAPTKKSRSSAPLVAGVLVVVLCALVFASTSLHVDHRRSVLVMARSLPAGAVLSRSDLTTKQIANTDSLASVSANQLNAMLGRSVAVPLSADALLTNSALGSSIALSSGDGEVGLSLKNGEFPSTLSPGARVRVFDTTSGISLVDAAIVTLVGKSNDTTTGGTTIDLTVPLDSSGSVTASAAADHVALVAVAP